MGDQEDFVMPNPSTDMLVPLGTRADASLLASSKAAWVLAATMFVATTVQVLATPTIALLEGEGPWPLPLPVFATYVLIVVACALQGTALAVSGRRPRVTVTVVVAVYLALLLTLDIPSWLVGMYLLISLALFILASRTTPAEAVCWLMGVLLILTASMTWWVMSVGATPTEAVGFVSSEVTRFAPPAAAGTALGLWWASRVRAVREAREEAELTKLEHDERVAAAQTAERSRIAQELHDVAGQHLAGLITLAEAASRLASSQPKAALEVVDEIREEGRFAAASLASALADLRATGVESVANTGDLRQVDSVVDFWRRKGMSIDYAVRGTTENLPAVVSSTAHRCIQEALTNAAKYAPGSQVQVLVRVTTFDLTVLVKNGPSAGSAALPGMGLGWGLKGIRERVELLRGSLSTRQTPEGGWELVFEIPVPSAD